MKCRVTVRSRWARRHREKSVEVAAPAVKSLGFRYIRGR